MVVTIVALLGVALLANNVRAAASYPPIPSDKTTPTQQRLAVYGPGGEYPRVVNATCVAPDKVLSSSLSPAISVGWNTYEQLSKPCVHYGTSSEKLSKTTCGDSSDSITYPTSRTWSNNVVLSGLKPATRYYYKIDSTNSSTDFFMSGRSAGDRTPFTMNSIIDLGVYGEDGYTLPADDKSRRADIPQIQPSLNHTTIGALAKTIDKYEIILHPGDFAYADDW